MGASFPREEGITKVADSTPELGDHVVHQSIVLAVNDSVEADQAFQWYLNRVHRSEDVVHIVHCAEMEHPSGVNYPDYLIPPEEWNDSFCECKSQGQTILNRYREKLQTLNISCQVHSEFGRPGPAVVRTAVQCHANQIIIGAPSLTCFLVGSTARYVAREAPVPVTVVPRVPHNRLVR